jgi:hypothetical protein
MSDNVIPFPELRPGLAFWNILAQDPQELAEFKDHLDSAKVLLPELTREELILWAGCGWPPEPLAAYLLRRARRQAVARQLESSCSFKFSAGA